MSANIFYNTATGKNSFFSRKELAWHGLGQIINKEIVTAKEAMIAAQANFTVIKTEGYAEISPGMFKKADNYYFTYRDDTKDVLGIVGNDYEVVQNVEAFDFIDNIIMGGEASFETAGVLGTGGKIFVTAKLPSYVKLGGEDIIEKYIFITTTHDGTGKIIAAITPIRVVCNNTLSMALSHCTQKIAFKHTKKVHDKLEMAHRLMGITNKYFTEFEDLLASLKRIPIGKEDAQKAACKIYLTTAEYDKLSSVNFDYRRSRDISTRKSNILDSLINTIDQGVGQEHHRGTALWVLNGITSFYQNTRDYRTEATKLDTMTDNKYTDLLTNGAKILLKNLY